ncbi:metalloregulator ArsR/SmtB family transcription factor [Luteolibacter sp. LG18]|uniref:ArsR/SmtB family transcription factor n=1 Tax=Luteolibacter sp. LG18 TaxID=2819286 RepID=UPI002B293378|nr:hypothetical protein llg_45510 [Luteolibacter sp. LG18]
MTENFVSIFQALGDETRWRIVSLVKDEALCVCELADILVMPQSSVSSHVQILRKAGMFESERCGKWTYFRIEPRTRALLGDIARHFPTTPGPRLEADAARAAARLEVRAQSCCRGPKALLGKSSTTDCCQP